MENQEQEYDMDKIKTIDDCIDFIIEQQEGGTENPDFKTWLQMPEVHAVVEAHHSLGSWLRNTLELWDMNEIVKYFNNLGIYHADDMSGIILTSLYRKYNNIEQDIPKQIARYREYWEKTDPKVNKGILTQ